MARRTPALPWTACSSCLGTVCAFPIDGRRAHRRVSNAHRAVPHVPNLQTSKGVTAMSMRLFTYPAPAAFRGRNSAPAARPAAIPVPVVVFILAGLTMLLNALDLVTFLRLTPDYGTTLEVNPIVRTVFEAGGPLAMAAVKLSVIGAATL